MPYLHGGARTITPSDADSRMARESSRQLARHLAAHHQLRMQVVEGEGGAGDTLDVPESALQLLNVILTEMARGNAVTIYPVHAELTTQQAADFLNVSRPYLVNLLEGGGLDFHKVGTHRRVKLEDLVAYRETMQAERTKALDELVAQAQELGMGY